MNQTTAMLTFLMGCCVTTILMVGPVNAVGCPPRCICLQKTVRCMRQQFQIIPEVPSDINIIDLRYNHIREVPSKIFTGRHNLHTIFLNENQLTIIHSAAFEGLPSLKYLYLNKNRISQIAPDAFKGLDKLQSLYLQFNEISHFERDVFSNLPRLERLFLYNNKITTIPFGSFENMRSLKRLRLDGNALQCDCSMMWLMKMMKINKNYVQSSATCSSPSDMAGKNMNSLKENDFHCKKPFFMNEPHDIEVNFGGTAIFSCHASGDPEPEIIWMLNSNKLHMDDPRINVLPDGSLQIENAVSSDVGDYECMAKNMMGEIISRPVRMIMSHSDINENVPSQINLKFTTIPLDAVVTPHESIVLHCAVEGNPEPQIVWYFNDQVLSQSTNRQRIHSNGTLVIDIPSDINSGIYKCEASNAFERISTTAIVKVNVVPRITVTPENQTLKSGAHVVLQCQAVGTPTPHISWERDGHPVVSTNRIYFANENTELHIDHIKESDSGLYVCIAENSVGSSEAIATLNIHNSISPPKLIFEPYDLEALQGSIIEIPCMGDGDPIPQVKWKKDGRTIVESGRYRIAGSGSLFITNITVEDTGRYECSIVNEYGRATASGLVTVRDNDVLAPGDKFVRLAFAEASREVDAAINQTVASLFSNTDGAKHHGDMFRLFRFPNAPARDLARAAEVYERTLVHIRKYIDDGMTLTANKTDFNYTELMSSEHLELVASLSGCMAHRVTPNCTDMCFHAKYRTIDGTCNNMGNPTWGASLTGFRRLLSPIYENELSMPVGWNKKKLYNGFHLPSSRLVSSSMIATPDEQITHMVMQWGQFLDHDLDHAIPSVSSESWDGVDCKKTCDYAAPCYPIEIPPNDKRVSNRRCLDFVRSSSICGSGMTSVFFNSIQPREQINQLTSYLDASQVYGYTTQFATDLRNLTSDDGLLRQGLNFPGQKPLLPFASPTDGVDCRRDIGESNVNCFTAGDIRVNEQVGLLAMHTIWFREHNRIAIQLKEYNPHWDGETLYQEARKIVGAQMQHITYSHWLPLILGPKGMEMLSEYKEYDPNVQASISNEFATAALRFGHSLINPVLHRLNENYEPITQGHLPLHKAFFAPWRIVYEGGVDPLMRGLLTVAAKLKMPDQNLNIELTEKLFHTAHAVALDLAAINIQRSRDHAIPSYNEYRKVCNLTYATTFEDLKKEISSPIIRKKLKELYGHPSNIDIWVGGILEDQVKGGKVGPLFRCLLIDQFRRLRDGDRFWYENPSLFKPEQLIQIKQSTLGRVLCENGDNITEVTDNVFVLPNKQGGYKKCQNIPEMDLKFWMDCNGCTPRPHNYGNLVRQRRRTRTRRDINLNNLNNVTQQITEDEHDDDDNFIDMNEERIEGLEQLIEGFQKTLKQMRRKLKKLEQVCSSVKPKQHGHCVDAKRNRRLNNEIWSENPCTRCECKHHQINCITEKCPPLKCDRNIEPIQQPDICCPSCPSITITSPAA